MKKEILIYCAIMCLATGFITYHLAAKRSDAIAVVDAVKLFNGYNMKQELEMIGKRQLQREKSSTDSLENVARLAKASGAGEEIIKRLVYDCNAMRSRLDADYAEINRDINVKVWKRLNPLLVEFGRQNKLQLIVGANGSGNVLYNGAGYDATEKVIRYVNNRYAEGR